MSSAEHDHTQLAAYALGALDPAEARAVHAHLAGCVECQHEVRQLTDLRVALDQVPPEAFLEGLPADDLVLQHTLRRARAEAAPPRRWSPVVVVAAAAAVAAVLAGGVLIGRQSAPDQVASPPTSTPSTSTAPPADARLAEATDPDTGTTMNVAVDPRAGWVWVTANITGLPVGARCELWVVPRDGERLLAGSWLVSEQGAREGGTIEGTALVDPADVAAIAVTTTEGQTMVSVPL